MPSQVKFLKLCESRVEEWRPIKLNKEELRQIAGSLRSEKGMATKIMWMKERFNFLERAS
jgi:hypothetical protein